MKSQKKLFSLRENIHYLNCAYKAPLLKSAEKACIEALIRERNPVDIKPDDFFEETEQVRSYFAKIINAEISQIAIVPSTSYGFSSVLKNTSGKKNGIAITVEDEFPSGYYSLKSWCIENANEMIIVKPDSSKFMGKSWNENILQQITEKTSIVLISSIHWMNGIKFDLQAIGEKCDEVGAKFIVDGTQSVGAMEMDVRKYKIDALICASYKWLLGPYSIALAYFSDNYKNGTPLEESWINRTNSNEFSNLTAYEESYKPQAARYNVGETSNFILMPILKESLRQIEEWNPSNIQKYCKKLIKPLIAYLKELNIEFEEDEFFCNHLFSLELPKEIDRETLLENLKRNNIYLSTRGKYLRISVNVFNNENDISKLIDTIKITAQNKV
jgi:selenocysteine lyase/cysteine desulfurase